MKMIQTFWTGPASVHEQDLLRMKAGWLSAEYHWMSWALSCLQALRQYGQLELVTDCQGKKILIDQLGLPYTSVSIALEAVLTDYPPELWSLAKIFTYSLQNEPFLHLDGDVFIWRPFEEEIMKSSIVAQNLEVDIAYYRNTLAEVVHHFTYLSPALRQATQSAGSLYASNTGVFGGHALDFIDRYCREAFLFVDNNRAQLDKVKTPLLNFIFEQCLLHYMGADENVGFTYIKKEPVSDPSYLDYARFIDVPEVDMIHPVGGYKKMAFICDHLAKRLRKDHPAYYYRIVEKCRENGDEMKSRIYYLPPFSQAGFYPAGYDACLQGTAPLPSLAPADVISTGADLIFARTIAALRYLGMTIPAPAALAGINEEAGDDATPAAPVGEEELARLAGKMKEGEEKEKLLEIFHLECAIAGLTKKLNDLPFLVQAYFKDIRHFAAIEKLFNQPEYVLMNTVLAPDDDIITLELTRHWHFPALQETWEDFMERKFSEEGSFHQVVLQVNAAARQVTETWPDKLDMIILSGCSRPLSTAVILQYAIEFFDEDQIKENYNSFKQLMAESLKRLLHTGLLRII